MNDLNATPSNAAAPCATSLRNWPGTGRFALGYGALIVLFFWPVLLGGDSFYFRDFGSFGYPLAHYHRECFWRGELPLWNPLACAGLPHLAQWNTLTLYPGSLIYLLLPLPWSLNFFMLAHLFLAGLGMYWLARQWTGNTVAAALAGLLYGGNGLLLNSMMWPNNLAAFGWMPWVIGLVWLGWRDGGRRLWLAMLAGAMQMLAGAPEVILVTWLIAAAWLAATLTNQSTWSERAWKAARFGGICTGVALLAAAQLLPFLELLGQSHRQSGWADQAWSLPAWGWANLLLPLFQCHPTGHGVYYQPHQYWTASFYIGGAGLLLALGALRERERLRFALAGLALFGLLMALGAAGKLYPALTSAIPQLNIMRFPAKYVVLAVFILPLLAAAGWSGLTASARSTAITAMAAGVLVLGGVLLAYGLARPAFQEATGGFLLDSLLHLALFAVAAVLAARILWGNLDPAKSNLFTGLLLAAVALDLFSQAPRMNPTVPAQTLAPSLLTERELRPFPGAGQGRILLQRELHDLLNNKMVPNKAQDVLGRRQAYTGNYNLLDGAANLYGFYSLYLPASHTLWEKLYYVPSNAFPEALADLSGVTFVPNPDLVLSWKHRPTALPLITAGQQPIFLPLSNHLARISARDFQPARVVYLPPESQATITAQAQSNVAVRVTHFSANRCEFETVAGQPAMVVLAQASYKNWRVFVDDAPVPWWTANHAFQAFQVPGGRHQIRLRYVDRAFQTGLGLSLAALVTVLAALVWCWRRAQR